MSFVVDSSALMAILLDEPERAPFRQAIAAAQRPRLSAVSMVEISLATVSRVGEAGLPVIEGLIAAFDLHTVPFTPVHATLARDAFLRFGRGRHPAGLNFGDCCAYALARAEGLPLLYKGADFALTDVTPALPEAHPPR